MTIRARAGTSPAPINLANVKSLAGLDKFLVLRLNMLLLVDNQ